MLWFNSGMSRPLVAKLAFPPFWRLDRKTDRIVELPILAAPAGRIIFIKTYLIVFYAVPCKPCV